MACLFRRWLRRFALAALSCALAPAMCLVPVAAGAGEEGRAEVERRVTDIRRRMDTALDNYFRAAVEEQTDQKGKADAMLIVGAFLELGAFGEPDRVKAAGYFTRAAEMGLAEANCSLGVLYASGAESATGRIEPDVAKALACYEKAAAGGSVTAMLNLGIYYADGVGGSKPDARKALPYLVAAAKRGNEAALARLKPVMDKAREWEAARPGRKADFPTSPEALTDPKLVEETRARDMRLQLLADTIYKSVNQRVIAANRDVLVDQPNVQ